MNLERVAEIIVKSFPEADLNKNEILQRLKLLVYEFKVPGEEAVRTIISWIKKELGFEAKPVAEEVKIADIGERVDEGDWVTVEVKVIKLWDTTNSSLAQAGLIGDETGVIKFVAWSKANKPELEEGKCYRLENVVVHKWKDRYQLNINRNSVITEIDKDIQPPEKTIEATVVMTKILSNSGLIRRCPECRRIVKENLCPVHGKVTPIDDLRLKVVFDDGKETYDAILNEEAIAKLTGINLDKAIEIAKERLDRGAVLSELKKILLCKYFSIKGTQIGKYILVKDISFLKPNFEQIIKQLNA